MRAGPMDCSPGFLPLRLDSRLPPVDKGSHAFWDGLETNQEQSEGKGRSKRTGSADSRREGQASDMGAMGFPRLRWVNQSL